MNKFLTLINKKQSTILWLSISLYFIILSLLCWWKYANFGYNGLDLAIFNQVFYNSSLGKLFEFTIHPQSFLGDHLALIIPLLLPFYYFFKSPLNLLFIQSAVLALSAWPIFLIAKKNLPKIWPLVISLLWLINPLVLNINLFEFHLLPMAILLILFAVYFYQKNNFPAFLIFCFASLLVREDVALVIIMFAVLALIDKRSFKWIFWPLVTGVGWFILAIQIINLFTPAGSYKFLYYYSWLGNNFQEIFTNSLKHPLIVIKHIATANNLLFTLTLFLSFAYLPLVKPKYLILSLLIYLEIILGGSTNSTLVLKLHYSSLFLPALFVSLIFAVKKITASSKNYFWGRYKDVFIIILITGSIYGSLTLGPIPSLIKNILITDPASQEINQLKNSFLKNISSDAEVASSYEFLNNLSSRPKVYSLHYAYIGKKQFSDLDYQLPDGTDTLAMDTADLLTFKVQFPNSQQWQEYFSKGDNNLKNLITERNFQTAGVIDTLVLMKKDIFANLTLYQTDVSENKISHRQSTNLNNKIKFIGWEATNQMNNFGTDLKYWQQIPLTLYFRSLNPVDKNYELKFTIKNKSNQVLYQKFYPLAYGLYPSSEWQPGQTIAVNYWLLMPKKYAKADNILTVELADYQGHLTINGQRSAEMIITEEKILGESFTLEGFSF